MTIESKLTEADWAEFRRDRIAEHLALGLPEAAAAAAAERAEARTKARLQWLRGRFERMTELWISLGAYWAAFEEAHPDIDLVEPDDRDLPLLADPPEQAELEAVEAEIAAARDHDSWPRHLYFGEV
ncbi:MAG: hypothetical protein QOJ91_1883 [Sphingomonadales bacterium]|jgi:hypothetical protein|nr:hypothetical protein [Sphingomonadales bacterium]